MTQAVLKLIMLGGIKSLFLSAFCSCRLFYNDDYGVTAVPKGCVVFV
jgi:hypothetical protein